MSCSTASSRAASRAEARRPASGGHQRLRGLERSGGFARLCQFVVELRDRRGNRGPADVEALEVVLELGDGGLVFGEPEPRGRELLLLPGGRRPQRERRP